MAFSDLQARIRSFFSGRGETSSRRPDGGTSCYRPVQRRDRQEEKIAQEKAAEYAAGQTPPAYAHTGFTGMNPPSADPIQAAYSPDPYGYGAAQAARQETWGGYGLQTEQAPAFGGYTTTTGNAMPDNISYMPGTYAPESGSSYTHVEHILAITSLRSCYEAIECMKNGETLIVTLDVLGSEGESIRCQDMLAGAAFTLRYTVRNLSSLGVIIIAPEGVKLLPEQRRTTFGPGAGYTGATQPLQETEQPRRERRVSQNPMGWNNSETSGYTGYNPYTGSMPAAAGAYGAFGGY